MRANRGRSSATSSRLAPPSSMRPTGAVRANRQARSLTQRALATITGPSPSSPVGGGAPDGSGRKSRACQIGALTAAAPVRPPQALAATGESGSPPAGRAGSASSAGIEGFLGGLGAQAGSGGEEGLRRPA